MLESRVSPIELQSTSVPTNRAKMLQCTESFATPALVFSTGRCPAFEFQTGKARAIGLSRSVKIA
jgi:hypothetical protein